MRPLYVMQWQSTLDTLPLKSDVYHHDYGAYASRTHVVSSKSWRITSNKKTWPPRKPMSFTVGDWCILPISSRVTPSADTGTIVKSQHLTWTCKINLCNAEFRKTWPFWEHLWIPMLSWWSWWRHATERVYPSLTIWKATGFRIQRASNMEL